MSCRTVVSFLIPNYYLGIQLCYIFTYEFIHDESDLQVFGNLQCCMVTRVVIREKNRGARGPGWGRGAGGQGGRGARELSFQDPCFFLASVRFRQFKNEIKTENKNRIGNTEKEIGLLMRNFSVRIFSSYFQGQKKKHFKKYCSVRTTKFHKVKLKNKRFIMNFK